MHHAPLIIDIAGTQLTDIDKKRLQHPLVGGVIYFTRNWESRAQITQLSADIKAIRPDLLIAVDHEGGRVQRFRKDGFTILPAMRALGQMWRKNGRSAKLDKHSMEAARAATARRAARTCAAAAGGECGVLLEQPHGSRDLRCL